MKELHDLRIQDKCHECNLRRHGFFCQFPEKDVESFASIKVTKAYPKRTTLFVEGQPSRGVYMLCQGRVKLSTCSPDGKIIILDIAEPGELLGLSAAINGDVYETTAEALEVCQVNYVKTSDLLRFLRDHPQASFNATRQLSRNYQTACRQVCSIGLSHSVGDKLAKLFLGWNSNGNRNGHGNSVHIKKFFTHSAIAEMIGASRETVTRAMKYFRDNDLVTLRGSELIIHDRKRLKAAIGTRMSKHTGEQIGRPIPSHENNGDLSSEM